MCAATNQPVRSTIVTREKVNPLKKNCWIWSSRNRNSNMVLQLWQHRIVWLFRFFFSFFWSCTAPWLGALMCGWFAFACGWAHQTPTPNWRFIRGRSDGPKTAGVHVSEFILALFKENRYMSFVLESRVWCRTVDATISESVETPWVAEFVVRLTRLGG